MDLNELLLTPTIVALPDVHSSSLARQKAQSLLAGGRVKLFLMEFQRSARTNDPHMADRYSTTLNGAISEMLDTNTSQDTAYNDLGTYFVGVNTNDAEPSLRKLAAIAIGNGVQVLACDADYQEAQAEVSRRSGNNITPLFGALGLEVRDTAASAMVGSYLRAAREMTTGRLMLWGANHFTENAPFGSWPDTRLQTLLQREGFIVHVATPEEMA